MKRFEYHITYDKRAKRWVCRVGGAFVDADLTKSWLICNVATELSYAEAVFGDRIELIIHRKDGTIGKGPGSRRSYGGDPKRSKG